MASAYIIQTYRSISSAICVVGLWNKVADIKGTRKLYSIIAKSMLQFLSLDNKDLGFSGISLLI